MPFHCLIFFPKFYKFNKAFSKYSKALYALLNVLFCCLKVVMFGDNVPRERADNAKEAARNCDALLVVGSAVMTMSAFRLARYY